MKANLGPIVESVFALDLFVRNNNVAFTAWRKQVRRRLGQRVHIVERLAPTSRPLSDLLWLLEQPTDADVQPRGREMAALFEFCKAAVMPYWNRTRGQLELEREARGRIAITKGVEHLLDTLHPRLHWKPPVLEVPDERSGDLYLDGRGLLLSPSSFLVNTPSVVLDADHRTVPPTLVFSVPPTAAAIATLCSASEANDHALSALVGHTRAAALQTLADSCTTSELAQRLNISSAGASQHATILREAGLITTCRNRNTVLHTLTPLGVALLQNGDPAIQSLASG
jgi:DNA-binding MarR family transcriptional regulator